MLNELCHYYDIVVMLCDPLYRHECSSPSHCSHGHLCRLQSLSDQRGLLFVCFLYGSISALNACLH